MHIDVVPNRGSRPTYLLRESYREGTQVKMAKHFELDIGEQYFSFKVLATSVAVEAALDGLYVIRSPLPPSTMDSAELVRRYKALTTVERAFRTLKTVNLKIRPIHHRTENRVRAHMDKYAFLKKEL